MLTLTEAAAILNLSPVTLRVQVRNGKLKAVKRGRDWHVTQAEVDRYAAENRKNPYRRGTEPMSYKALLELYPDHTTE